MKENKKGLLILGILSIWPFGLFAGIPGILMKKKYYPLSKASIAGLWMCWIGTALSLLYVFLYLAFSAA